MNRNTRLKMADQFTSPFLKLLALSALFFVVGGSTNADVVFQPLHAFGQEGPTAPLMQGSDGNLYGTLPSGGAYGFGEVFRATTKGASTVLYSFTGRTDGSAP